MRFRRLFCCLLAVLMLLGCIAVLPADRARALDFTTIEGKLSKWQYYFCRTLMSIALKDSYDAHAETGKNIFPSITCGQACFEGGICGAPISVIGKNHFAVRAYSYFTGKVYDDDELVVYDSYADAVNIKGQDYVDGTALWRAYDTWEECINDHTQMFLTQERYAAVISATNYDEAAQAYQDTKYKGAEANYKENLLKRVEGYDFVQLDSVTADANGIFGLIMSESNVLISSGDTYQLAAYSYPKTDFDCSGEIVWESSEPNVATVSQDGTVTAVSAGYTLITADYGTKEACCIVCVDCNAYVMYGNYALYSKPDGDADSLGKLLKGQPIHLDSSELFVSDDGTEYYAATARVSNGKLVSGYVRANRVHVNTPSRLSVSTPFSTIQMDPGEKGMIPLTVHAEEMSGKAITWESSNPDVVTVDQNGNLQAFEEGVAVIYIYADGEIALTVPVFVGSPVLSRLYTIRDNDLRIRPVSDKTDNEYGTIKVGTYAWVLSVPAKGWYRVLTYVDGRYYDGYVKTSYFRDATEDDDDSADFSNGSHPVSGSAGPPPESSVESAPVSQESSGQPSDIESSEVSEFSTITVTFRTGEVNADDLLNVREKPSTDSERVVRLPSKTIVTILDTVQNPDEKVFKTWYYISVTYGGRGYEGYAAADYIELTGTQELTLDEPVHSGKYGIDDIHVTGIIAPTSAAALAKGLERDIEVYRKDVLLPENKNVGTGDVIRFYIGRIPVYSRIAVVVGDVDGNGMIGAADYLLLKRHVLGTYSIDGTPFLAGCITGKKSISAQDYLVAKRVVLGSYKLSEES